MIYADVTELALGTLAEMECMIIELYVVSCGSKNDSTKQVQSRCWSN